LLFLLLPHGSLLWLIKQLHSGRSVSVHSLLFLFLYAHSLAKPHYFIPAAYKPTAAYYFRSPAVSLWAALSAKSANRFMALIYFLFAFLHFACVASVWHL
jgi:hypothetical protein